MHVCVLLGACSRALLQGRDSLGGRCASARANYFRGRSTFALARSPASTTRIVTFPSLATDASSATSRASSPPGSATAASSAVAAVRPSSRTRSAWTLPPLLRGSGRRPSPSRMLCGRSGGNPHGEPCFRGLDDRSHFSNRLVEPPGISGRVQVRRLVFAESDANTASLALDDGSLVLSSNRRSRARLQDAWSLG